MDFSDFVNSLFPNPEDCRRKARELRESYPDLTEDQLVDRAITTARRWGAAFGAGSGVASNPMTMIPAAMADMALTMSAEARLVGVIGAILDSSSLNDHDGFRGDIAAVMFPNAVSQALREAAVQAGKATTKTLIRKHISKELLKTIIAFAAKYLGVKVTQRAIIAKTVPLIGSAIGAGWNWVDVERCGRRAVKFYREAEQNS